jgi:zinc transporter 1/2/3
MSLLPEFSSLNITSNGTIEYVSTLSQCTFSLLHLVCDAAAKDNNCIAGLSDTIDIHQQCVSALTSLSSRTAFEEDTCINSSSLEEIYNQDLHIAALFIIFAASMLGSFAPLLGKYIPRFVIHPFIIVVGKCLGIGILLACALVHMLQPSNAALTNECLPHSFTEGYAAYAYLFAMLAILMMHFIDFTVEHYVKKFYTQSQQQHATTPQPSPDSPCCNTESGLSNEVQCSNCDGDENTSIQINVSVSKAVVPSIIQEQESPTNGGHSHSHGILLDKHIQRTLAAFLLEFGVTSHSILVGLQVGVVSEAKLHVLIVALCFHQCFEGVALGSRVVDAAMSSKCKEFLFLFCFAISAPIGIGIGIALISNFNPNGATYLLIQGTLDGVCAGILLYLGLMLLSHDFHEDLHQYGYRKTNKYNVIHRCSMFIALWLGGGLMAFIGKYL